MPRVPPKVPIKTFPPADPLWIAEVNRRFEFGRLKALAHLRAVMTEVRYEYAGMSAADFMASLGYSESQWKNWFYEPVSEAARNTRKDRNGPPFAVIQGIIHAYDVPAEVFDVDFTGRS